MRKSLEELPVMFSVDIMGEFLPLSRARRYELVSSQSFYPAIRIGKRIVIEKQAFIKWVNENLGKQVEA